MPPSDDLTPARLRDKPSWLLSQTAIRAHRLLTQAFADANSRGYHYRLLAALHEFGPASQAALSRRASLDRSDVVATVDELVARGLVERATNPHDRRGNIITITPAGTAQLLRLDKVVAQVQDALLSSLSSAERRQLIALLTRVLEYQPNAPSET